MWTRFLLIAFFGCVTGRQCWECTGQNGCLAPKNVTCEHDGFGCAKIEYETEPYIEKGCLYRKETQTHIKLTTCTRKNRRDGEKYRICGCMGKDMCNNAFYTSSFLYVIIISLFLSLFIYSSNST